jgi:hypothetical protein
MQLIEKIVRTSIKKIPQNENVEIIVLSNKYLSMHYRNITKKILPDTKLKWRIRNIPLKQLILLGYTRMGMIKPEDFLALTLSKNEKVVDLSVDLYAFFKGVT